MIGFTIGDFLMRIKNAARAGRREVRVPTAKFVLAVAEVLKKEGFLEEVKVDKKEDAILVQLAYSHKEPVLLGMKLVSKPGLRVYMTQRELAGRKKLTNLILSTPKGIMPWRRAKKEGVGGEVIAEIW